MTSSTGSSYLPLTVSFAGLLNRQKQGELRPPVLQPPAMAAVGLDQHPVPHYAVCGTVTWSTLDEQYASVCAVTHLVKNEFAKPSPPTTVVTFSGAPLGFGILFNQNLRHFVKVSLGFTNAIGGPSINPLYQITSLRQQFSNLFPASHATGQLVAFGFGQPLRFSLEMPLSDVSSL